MAIQQSTRARQFSPLVGTVLAIQQAASGQSYALAGFEATTVIQLPRAPSAERDTTEQTALVLYGGSLAGLREGVVVTVYALRGRDYTHRGDGKPPVPAAPPPEPYVRPDFKGMIEKFEFARLNGPLLDQYKECLYGGSGDAGRKIFFEKAEASCIRCHRIGNKGGDVGPNLQDLALRHKDREYILESIVDPNKVIAPGFESASVKTKDGLRITGVVKKDDDKVLVLADGNGLVTIQKDNIETRKTGQSPMPVDIYKQLTKNELRDLVEFLANQKTEIAKPKEEDSKHEGK